MANQPAHSVKTNGPHHYRLAGATIDNVRVSAAHVSRADTPRRTIVAFVFAVLVSLGLWMAIAAGFFALK